MVYISTSNAIKKIKQNIEQCKKNLQA